MRKALIVGFNNYPGSPLNGCINDAISMSNILERNADGSPNFSINIMTDETDKITKGMFKREINNLFSDECSVALLYFSGHGSVTNAGGIIVTPDYKTYDEGVSMSEILTIANKSKAREKIIILDCCHSGSFGTNEIDNSEMTSLCEGMTILTASRKDQVSVEVDGSGLFTKLVIDALYGGAADLRGYVTPGSVYAYVDSALGAWGQRPVFKTNVTRFTQLRQVSPLIPVQILRELPQIFNDPHNEFQLDSSYEDSTKHKIQDNVDVFKKLQKMFSVGLVVPVDEEYMYFAAINSKSCKLTALGYHYWNLARNGLI